MTSNFLGRLTAYVQLKVEKCKLDAIVFTSKILANVLVLSVLIVVGFFFLLFCSLGFSIYLNNVLQSTFAGYFVMAGIYLVCIVIIFVPGKQKKMRRWIENLILTVAEESNESKNTRKDQSTGE